MEEDMEIEGGGADIEKVMTLVPEARIDASVFCPSQVAALFFLPLGHVKS